MSKIIIYDQDAKNKILAGAEKLEQAVSITLGPCGRNVIIDEYGTIHSSRDGVTVAKSIDLKDKFENIGASAIKEVAEKSNDVCGDGTTTSTILATAIFKNGLKYIKYGSNPTLVKNGINIAAKKAIEYVKSLSKPISTKEDIKRVATVSANHDSEIGETIADVMDKIGKDGTIKVENGNTMDIHSKIVDGMVIDQGYLSPYLVTDTETNEADLEDAFVLIANKKLSNIQELLPCLQSVTKLGAPLLIIANELQDEILSTIIVNKLRGFNCVAVKSPSYGDNQKQILEDIAVLCGGKVVSDETAVKLESAVAESNVLGRAKKIVVKKDSTLIMGGCGSAESIEERANSLRNEIQHVDSEYAKGQLRDRLAKLTGGIGIISVGAATEAERKEKRDRVDDAFSAAKAAVRSGIVPGGGIALLNARKHLTEWVDNEDSLAYDEKIGAGILAQSLYQPISQLLVNAGFEPAPIIDRIEEGVDNGYDVLNKKYVNMVEAGIIDPTEVVVNEIQNAASIGGLLLVTDCLIVDEPEDKAKRPDGGMPAMY